MPKGYVSVKYAQDGYKAFLAKLEEKQPEWNDLTEEQRQAWIAAATDIVEKVLSLR